MQPRATGIDPNTLNWARYDPQRTHNAGYLDLDLDIDKVSVVKAEHRQPEQDSQQSVYPAKEAKALADYKTRILDLWVSQQLDQWQRNVKALFAYFGAGQAGDPRPRLPMLQTGAPKLPLTPRASAPLKAAVVGNVADGREQKLAVEPQCKIDKVLGELSAAVHKMLQQLKITNYDMVLLQSKRGFELKIGDQTVRFQEHAGRLVLESSTVCFYPTKKILSPRYFHIFEQFLRLIVVQLAPMSGRNVTVDGTLTGLFQTSWVSGEGGARLVPAITIDRSNATVARKPDLEEWANQDRLSSNDLRPCVSLEDGATLPKAECVPYLPTDEPCNREQMKLSTMVNKILCLRPQLRALTLIYQQGHENSGERTFLPGADLPLD